MYKITVSFVYVSLVTPRLMQQYLRPLIKKNKNNNKLCTLCFMVNQTSAALFEEHTELRSQSSVTI